MSMCHVYAEGIKFLNCARWDAKNLPFKWLCNHTRSRLRRARWQHCYRAYGSASGKHPISSDQETSAI